MHKLMNVLLAGLLVGLAPVLAQGDTPEQGPFLEFGQAHDLMASDLIGTDLYLSTTPVTLARVDALPLEWEKVARISDLLIGSDGMVRGVLVNIGGVLGVGARKVMVALDALTIVERAGTNEVFVVLIASREQFATSPTFVSYMGRIDVGDPIGRVGSVDAVEGYARVEWSTLSADDLRGAEVYDRHNVRVAGIRDVEFSTDGRMLAVLIDVGGFLGIIGTRTVAVPMEQLDIHRSADLAAVRVYLAMTEEELLALPTRE